MMTRLRICLVAFVFQAGLGDLLADRYVVAPGTIASGASAPPYDGWGNAATQIQWAVNVAASPETIWVSNGVYLLTNQVVVTNGITLRSMGGPAAAIINGNFIPGAPATNRCLLLSNAAAFVRGFTLTNGATTDSGGGARIYSGTMSNCSILNNTSFGAKYGGGIYISSGTVKVCLVAGNLATNSSGGCYGGGIYAWGSGSRIEYCTVSNNACRGTSTGGGGGGVNLQGGRIYSSVICNNYLYQGYGCGVSVAGYGLMSDCLLYGNQGQMAGGCSVLLGIVTNCVVSNNNAAGYASGMLLSPEGGGGHSADPVRAYNTTVTAHTNVTIPAVTVSGNTGRTSNLVYGCTIADNAGPAVQLNGTNVMLSHCEVLRNRQGVSLLDGTIRNCLIAGSADRGGVVIEGKCGVALISGCTIAGNLSTNAGAGLRTEATNVFQHAWSSCVIYSNGASGADDLCDAKAPANYNYLQYSCVGANPGFTGAWIMVSNPDFANAPAGNYRLNASSPCINAGLNEEWMATAKDLGGDIRIRYGTVDMGAYEKVYEGTLYQAK